MNFNEFKPFFYEDSVGHSSDQGPIIDAMLKRVFDSIDHNKDRFIEVEELAKRLAVVNGKEPPAGEVKKMFDSVDTNKDGKIDLEEFKIKFLTRPPERL